MNDLLTVSVEKDYLRMEIAGDLNNDALPCLRENIDAWKKVLINETNGGKNKIRVLVDASGTTERYHPSALTELTNMAKWNQDYVEKSAIFGIPEVLRVSAAIIKTMAGRSNMELFRKEEDAIEWLLAD